MKELLSSVYYHAQNFLVAAETKVDFYNQNGAGEGEGSILPFIGFMCAVFALVALGTGAVRYISARKKFNMFFDQRDQKDAPDEAKYEKEKRAGMVSMIVGAVLMVLSFVLL